MTETCVTGNVSIAATQDGDGTGKVSSFMVTYTNPDPPPAELNMSFVVGDGCTQAQWDIALAYTVAEKAVEVCWDNTTNKCTKVSSP